jgi:hypothetical protein
MGSMNVVFAFRICCALGVFPYFLTTPLNATLYTSKFSCNIGRWYPIRPLFPAGTSCNLLNLLLQFNAYGPESTHRYGLQANAVPNMTSYSQMYSITKIDSALCCIARNFGFSLTKLFSYI